MYRICTVCVNSAQSFASGFQGQLLCRISFSSSCIVLSLQQFLGREQINFFSEVLITNKDKLPLLEFHGSWLLYAIWYDRYDCCKRKTHINVVSIFMCNLYFALNVFVSSAPTIVWNHFNLFVFVYLVKYYNLCSCNWLYINNSCKHDPPRLA